MGHQISIGLFCVNIALIIVISLLTVSSIDGEVVWYNSDHILNLRLRTMPVEDLFYSVLMLGLTI